MYLKSGDMRGEGKGRGKDRRYKGRKRKDGRACVCVCVCEFVCVERVEERVGDARDEAITSSVRKVST